ncbi:hypothetical protein AC579_9462 [Pseudocercospora musae]|uniref:Uncharacterized protein n=1 Tax=Pseudocercospora musae TaxID=113226 RepID=A0A139I9A7_9PEZI|nr:hypothetical protein AC579_9462 [Pseudocercospora musae]
MVPASHYGCSFQALADIDSMLKWEKGTVQCVKIFVEASAEICIFTIPFFPIVSLVVKILHGFEQGVTNFPRILFVQPLQCDHHILHPDPGPVVGDIAPVIVFQHAIDKHNESMQTADYWLRPGAVRFGQLYRAETKRIPAPYGSRRCSLRTQPAITFLQF